MCGIIGAISQRNVVKTLINGLYRLEYRGYDSVGLAIVDENSKLFRVREVGKTIDLDKKIQHLAVFGKIGIAHTRWATHGKLSERNAHPHVSDYISIVHNGTIENYRELKTWLRKKKYLFFSETDSEVIAHLIHWETQRNKNLLRAVQKVVLMLHGNYSIIAMDSRDPKRLVSARTFNPLIIGLGKGENFLASDQVALSSIVERFLHLKKNEIAEVSKNDVKILSFDGRLIERRDVSSQIYQEIPTKGLYRYYMEKEIYEQPEIIEELIKDRFDSKNNIFFSDLEDSRIEEIFIKMESIQIVACGTSYNAGMVGKYWFESFTDISCNVEIASEYCCRNHVISRNSLLITLSQSGETADTISALNLSKNLKNYLASLAICNVSNSYLVRESDFSIMTKAGMEISVASSKSFTAQLTTLLLLVAYIRNLRKKSKDSFQKDLFLSLKKLPKYIEKLLLNHQEKMNFLISDLFDKRNVLILGRGDHFPIALEGALKLKEIAYIHAEANYAGELKHGPLALVDKKIPIIIIAPYNGILSKIRLNIEEIRSRRGMLYVITDERVSIQEDDQTKIISLFDIEEIISPIFYAVPFQILAYNIALFKNIDMDHPRNLAKSVTVE
ncbi:glutamine--fructose-6-phosphate transaminase (isomerizing) [Candidatus Riesia pediculicola]|uniref:Glutamine--fructose-6-phosphate aminotransferase [isomerizing] n=1 Tax=Riesia pediculicola (strain USDA) TaxID=515618 RepID=D4G7R7_RIEPU|nr:glutamine--fructose-6-phosphate transaminase (isomerizing) [Candidatus Riesia pediculicola]ADD79891.1 glucosamine--fructose-6-phosphate aminotransferase, isomerizing [Candidatus Riesia pediculicola USDA]ARC53639.1 glucosamine--fructose-6-phosphate aminotransferase [Candidatus Riesia pediculicola]QOJ86290.1 glutamine--fructose-6-phosphate transaminase (isomerizing) [Candidatus Riesia pediculicola]